MSGKRQNNQLRLSFSEEVRSEAPTAPGGGSETPTAKRMSESPASNHEQLMEEVCAHDNCVQAYKRVKSNKGSPGIDGMTVEQLPEHLKEHWPAIREQLLNGTYKPQPVKRVEIPKPDGGVRQLGIPTALDRITGFIMRRLKLQVNETKSAVARPADRKFLGFSFTRAHEPKRRIAVKALVRFKQKVRELTGRTRGIGIEQMAKELAGYLRGWKSYFGFSETPSVLERLDQWIRQRLRSVIWKQWKRGKRRFANLHQRGVGSKLAAQTAGSSHGPWRIANSPAMKYAFPNAHFDSLGLPRLFAGE